MNIFKGCHYPKDVIMMAVRWYLAYPLSYRNVEELLEERGVHLDHATANRWVIKFSVILEKIFRKRKKPVGNSWRMDETYIKIKGKWFYYYRATDKAGKTIDFYLSEKRDEKAARGFFEKAIASSGKPEKVNIDKSGANLAALTTFNDSLPEEERIIIRQLKILNQIIEQDHRFIKKITKPIMGFKSFLGAQATLIGIELCHMLKKGQNTMHATLSPWQQFYALVG